MVNLEVFKAQIEAVDHTAHGRVVGSIGRIATFQDYLDNPFIEFDLRGRNQLPAQPADLDLIGVTPAELQVIRAIDTDVSVDDAAFNSLDVRLKPRTEVGAWVISSHLIPTEVYLPQERFAKTVSVVDGIAIPTIPARTHALLHGLRIPDSKDVISSELLRQATTHVEQPDTNYEDYLTTSYFVARLQQAQGPNSRRYYRVYGHTSK